jgi:choline dehydrogenase-like flavoprotein
MSRTLLPKAKALGVKIIPNCEARKINFDNRKAKSLTARVPHEGGSTDIEVAFQTLFICGGPVQSAALLIKSGVKRNIGTSFYVHPMVKMTAKFNEIIDAESAPLPVFQVTTPGGATLGGSVFSTSFAGMALGGMNATGLQELPNHQQMASYYVSSAGTGVGSVKVLPFIGSTMTRYKLSGKDINTLQEGAATLIRLLFEAGAEKVIPDASHIDAAKWISKHSSRSTEIPEVNKLSLSTVHAFSSCRMGEDESIYPVDSSGKLFATDNVYVADASILPDAPGVNPQATIMAMALRIARRFGN